MSKYCAIFPSFLVANCFKLLILHGEVCPNSCPSGYQFVPSAFVNQASSGQINYVRWNIRYRKR